MGVISGCLIMPDFIHRFGQGPPGARVLTSSRQSIITSVISAGTFLGSLLQSLTSDRLGRRPSLLIWAAIFTAGIAVQVGTGTALAQLVLGRFVAGLGVGAMSAIVPLYNGETVPRRLRGAMLVMYQLQINFGFLASYVVEQGTHTIRGSASWRSPIGLQLLWGLVLLSGMFFLPESPRHLLFLAYSSSTSPSESKYASRARRVVAQMNGVPADDALVDDVLAELQYGIKAENEGGRAGWAECFSRNARLGYRTVNGMMLQGLQQINGQNFYCDNFELVVTDYYGDTFFQSAGAPLSPYSIQTILGVVSVVGTLPSLVLIETFGRRNSLLTGAALQAAFALIAGLVGHFTLAAPHTRPTQRNKEGGGVLIAFAVLQVFAFSASWGPAPWVYVGESFPLRVRSRCIALAVATNWVWNFLGSFFAPRIAARIGPLILLIFCGILVFAFGYVYLFIPETKGLRLEEVDEMYRSGVKPWNSYSWRPSLFEKPREEPREAGDGKEEELDGCDSLGREEEGKVEVEEQQVVR
ncbi:general substrate transporter [Gloeophyllum trabeum ATCC 11539]|uniref:General substrate transporter n=1 Tax=Gloeophyllum trabeum (strain ATCC 11539 / FP-39264 / Madison 617) TaxID=670483 RepID=S7QJY6_GLOTA|nr:general substrate transporter [Gloeophyllum trabeum ATCC 11539]EPQ60026.1 general substrate transporter [Gloeophyllum trabeum ATCC 11539]